MKLVRKFAILGMTVLGMQAALAAPINIAVLSDSSGLDTSAQVAAQLNDDTYYDFSATVLSGASVTSIAALSGYSAVVLGGSGYTTNGFSASTLGAISSFMTAGGGVVTAGWYRYSVIGTTGQGATDANFITPIVTGGSYDYVYNGTLQITNGTHAITTGVNNISVSNCCIERANALDVGATSLGNAGGLSALAYQDQVGRSAYLGLLYFANSNYANSGLRSGDGDRLLEQAVAWAAGASGGNAVPEPGSLALLGLGLAGLSLVRRRKV